MWTEIVTEAMVVQAQAPMLTAQCPNAVLLNKGVNGSPEPQREPDMVIVEIAPVVLLLEVSQQRGSDRAVPQARPCDKFTGSVALAGHLV